MRRAKKFTRKECSSASASHIASGQHKGFFCMCVAARGSSYLMHRDAGLSEEYRQGDFTKLVPDMFALERLSVA